jgi:hypothetical protein
VNIDTNMAEENRRSGPGVGAALVAFVIFAGICAGSVALARRHGTLYDDARPGDRSAGTSELESVEAQAIMRQASYFSDSQSFRRAELVTIAGRGELDLSAAKMKGDRGRLEVVVIAGAAIVKVPPDWAVVSADNIAAAGVIENRAKQAEGTDVKKVRLEAFVLAGRLDVIH